MYCEYLLNVGHCKTLKWAFAVEIYGRNLGKFFEKKKDITHDFRNILEEEVYFTFYSRFHENYGMNFGKLLKRRRF